MVHPTQTYESAAGDVEDIAGSWIALLFSIDLSECTDGRKVLPQHEKRPGSAQLSGPETVP